MWPGGCGLWRCGRGRGYFGSWFGCLAVGALLPPYTQGATVRDSVGLRFVKVFGRCFLPPSENSKGMMIVFAGVVGGHRGCKCPDLAAEAVVISGVEIGFLLALLPAVALGVSTRTSEGDRLLYFPSCLLVSAGGCDIDSFCRG